MIEITKSEAMQLRKKVPGCYIRPTVGKYYAEPTAAVLAALPNNEDVKRELENLKRAEHR